MFTFLRFILHSNNKDLKMQNNQTQTLNWLADAEGIIRARRSIRGYKNTPVTQETQARIMHALNTGRNPFKSGHRFNIIENSNTSNENLKLDTYGVIKGANTYLLSAMTLGDNHLEALGFDMEYAVLQAQSEGIGTCWLGGTFNKSQFATAMQLASNEILPIVIPLGIPATKDGLVGQMIRSLAGSNNRLPFESLFFKDTYGSPLTMSQAGKYAQALEMVRLGPSASNKQPWRAVLDDNTVHFYLKPTKGYAKALSYDIQRVDMGIAICHFDAMVQAQGIPGHFEKLKDTELDKSDDSEYIISFVG